MSSILQVQQLYTVGIPLLEAYSLPMINNQTRKECLSQEQMAASHVSRFICIRVFCGVKMADLSYSRTNKKCSSFATKHFQRKSCKDFDLHLPLRRLVSFVARIVTRKVRCWVTDTHTGRQTHGPSTVTLAAQAHWGLMKYSVARYETLSTHCYWNAKWEARLVSAVGRV